jgi:hypothetical protein
VSRRAEVKLIHAECCRDIGNCCACFLRHGLDGDNFHSAFRLGMRRMLKRIRS